MTATLPERLEGRPEADTPTDDGPVGDGATLSRTVPASLEPWTPTSPRRGWVLLAIVVAVAAVTRFWALAFPATKSFDEVYYATNAEELLRFGYEDNRGYMFVVHPPLGKWLIAATSALFHEPTFRDAWGWRAAPAIAGVLCVVIVARVARRMFRSEVLGAVAGLLLALDGVTLVQSRVALLDIFLELFVLAGFAALVVDRDRMRATLAGWIADGVDLRLGLPALGPRPWRLVAGVMFGAAVAVKWSGLSWWIGFALLSLWWDRNAFKAAGARSPFLRTVTRSAGWAVGSLGLTPILIYAFTWTGWFAGENSWNRHYGDGKWYGVIGALAQYHHQAYEFHKGLDSFHPYKSNPWSWLVLGRPVTYYYEQNGVTGCGPTGTTCAREILLIGTPLMWWGFVPALLFVLWSGVTRRDWRGGVALTAMVVGWLVWFPNPHRTMFLFYMAPLVPFLVLALTQALGALLGPAVPAAPATDDGGPPDPWLAARRRRRAIGAAIGATYLGVIVVDFVWMWPLYTGGLLTYSQWQAHMWFPSWV
ncbi:dolichyl-phosphate-mannose--protein mannosyltransferase [Jatrophihabitans sp. YIM 134969]